MIWTHCEVYWALDFEPFENEWQAASGIGGLWCVAWRLFFGSIDHFCFCWLSRFLRKICSMIPLIVFVFVDFRIFNGRFVAWLHWSFLFSVIFAFFTRDLYHDSFDHFCFRWILHFQRETCRRCGKTAMIPLIIFFAVNLAALDGAIPKLHVKNLPEKNCRWEGAIPILGAPRTPMCGKLRYSFRRTLILSCARTFLQQKPVLKGIFIPARLQHINVNMLRIFVIEDAFLR